MNRKPILLLGIFVVLLMSVSLVEVSAQPISNSQTETLESTEAQAPQNTITFLNKVAGIDTDDYTITINKVSTTQVVGSQKQQTSVSLILSNEQRSLGVAMILIEGKVRFYDLSILSGTFDNKESNIFDDATIVKAAIQNYGTYFNASHCNEFDSAIPNNITAQNSTSSAKGIKLKTSCLDEQTSELCYTTFEWYKANGIDIPAQSVQAVFCKNGILTSFADNLGLYEIATTNVEFSKEQAVDKALPLINKCASDNNIEVKSIDATLQYRIDFEGCRGDSYMIYPVWSIMTAFDSPLDDVQGYNALVWADTGEVYYEAPISSVENITSNAEVNSSLLLFVIAIPIVSALVLILLQVRSKKCALKHALKIGGFLFLCCTILSMLVIQPCSAYPSTIYGSRHAEDATEISYMAMLSDQIEYMSQSSGYTTYNWYGSSTTENNYYVGASGHSEPFSIVYYSGHGGYNPQDDIYGILTDNGDYVCDYDIEPYSTVSNRHKFVFLNTCYQGNEIDGMPSAWLEDTSLSSNGYLSSDNSLQLFLGYNEYGPNLSGTLCDSQGGSSIAQTNYNFVAWFYYYALYLGYNVHAALDASTQQLWQLNFNQSILYNGWYYFDGQQIVGPCGNMVVYGHGYMYISPTPKHVTVNCNSTEGSTWQWRADGWYSYGTNTEIHVDENEGYYFDHWIVDGSQTVYDNPLPLSMTADHTVEAVFTTTPNMCSVMIFAEGAFSHAPATDAGIYVDGNYVGSGTVYLQLTQGVHQIAIDDYYYGVPFWHFHDFHDDTWDDVYNGQYVYFNSPHCLQGLYYG